MLKEWKDVEGYERLYRVSNYGEVFSWKSKKLLSPRVKNHYLYVMLYKDGKSKECPIHSIVLKSFTDESEWKTLPNHLDFDTHNNKLNNLQWSTRSENLLHFYKNNKRKKLLKNDEINEIRELYCSSKLSELEIANIYNFKFSIIHNIVQNNTYYDKNYSPPTRKFKNGYSYEFLINLKDMYYVYGLGFQQISNLLGLNYNYTYAAILNHHKQLD